MSEREHLDPDAVQFRRLDTSDDAAEINALLRAAYGPLADAGMKYAASHEDVEATRKNLADGECHLAILGGKIVGCVILRLPAQGESSGWKAKGPSWYSQPGVTSFGRFAVFPHLQGNGLGARMMDRIEARAKELGFVELALDTSERAHHLIEMYEKRGYRFIEYHQWEITNYRSVIMSKRL